MKKIIVCSSNAVTGGPELLHQLVDALRKINKNSYIAYYPFENNYKIPEEYKKYNCKISELEDEEDNIIIIPETATWICDNVKKAQVYIWWLSINNYQQYRHKSKIINIYRKLKGLIFKKSKSINEMRKYKHLAQSYYAWKYLKDENIEAEILGDYLNKQHLIVKNLNNKNRKNQILYNPKKGMEITRKLINKYQNLRFIPIEKMNREEVTKIFNESKIYIDFGEHPGKDRMPREAVMAGCCIITGIKGSAKYYEDIPIKSKYKLNQEILIKTNEFEKLVQRIFENYDEEVIEFDEYKKKIECEYDNFNNDVIKIFGNV